MNWGSSEVGPLWCQHPLQGRGSQGTATPGMGTGTPSPPDGPSPVLQGGWSQEVTPWLWCHQGPVPPPAVRDQLSWDRVPSVCSGKKILLEQSMALHLLSSFSPHTASAAGSLWSPLD